MNIVEIIILLLILSQIITIIMNLINKKLKEDNEKMVGELVEELRKMDKKISNN